MEKYNGDTMSGSLVRIIQQEKNVSKPVHF